MNNPRSIRTLAFALFGLFACTAFASAQSVPDERFYYKLTTAFQGPDLAMTVWDDGALAGRIRMENFTGRDEQLFRFIPNPNVANSYRISSLARGENLPIGIENGGPRNNQPRLVQRAARSGQIWFFTQDQLNPPYRRMTTLFRGPGLSLEGAAGPNLDMPELLPTGPFSGQAWLFTPVRSIAPPSVTPFGSGCLGGAGTPVLTATSPTINQNLRFEVTPVTIFESVFLRFGFRSPNPLRLDFVGAPGCLSLIDSIVTVQMPSNSSRARIDLTTPNDLNLAGLTLSTQAILVGFIMGPDGQVSGVSQGLDLFYGL